jgi:hypothetical protein
VSKNQVRKHPGTVEARRVLVLEGREMRFCEKCGTGAGPIHVHHIDRNPYNNRAINLMLLCARCHATEHKRDTFWNPDLAISVDDFSEESIPMAEATHDVQIKTVLKIGVFACGCCNQLTRAEQTGTEIREPDQCAHCYATGAFKLILKLSTFKDEAESI